MSAAHSASRAACICRVAVASLFVPGVGPIPAGLVGPHSSARRAAAGAAAGGAMEDTVAGGLPADELYSTKTPCFRAAPSHRRRG